MIYNLDETSINFSQKSNEQIIVTRSHKARLVSHPDRICSSTLVLCIPAEGSALDSTLIWPQAKIPDEFGAFPVKHIRVYCQKSAYQTRNSFSSMLKDYYLPHMIQRRTALRLESTPILLIMDGHTSRLSTEVIKYCQTANIILLIIPSHTSHLTQPLDCSPNGSLKNAFAVSASKIMNHPSVNALEKITEGNHSSDQTDSSKQRTEDNTGDNDEISDVMDDEADEEKIPPIPDKFFSTSGRKDVSETSSAHRRLLAEALPRAIEKATSYESMMNGWKKSGLYPYNPSLVLDCLRTGEAIEEKQLHTPSISGRVLTEKSTMISIWTWRIQQLNKEMKKKDMNSKRKDEMKQTIGELEEELNHMLEGYESNVNVCEKQDSQEKQSPMEEKQDSQEKQIEISDEKNHINLNTKKQKQTKGQGCHQTSSLKRNLAPMSLSDLPDPPSTKRLAIVEMYDDLLEAQELGLKVEYRYERRAHRGEKRLPPGMMGW